MTITVRTRDGRDVEAQVLVGVDGRIIVDATGAPMLAPLDYDPEDDANFARLNANEYLQTNYSILYQFRTNGPLDLQRNYNGATAMGGGGFVAEFTPVASYSLGYTGAALGVNWLELIAGGGAVNARNKYWLGNKNVDDSGMLWNNPKNVPNIIKGYLDYLNQHPDGKGSLCFPASTPIQTSLTSTTSISNLRVGDTVLAFDPHTDDGRGALVPRRVTKLFSNVTTEWVKLSWVEAGVARELVATPGHHFLDQLGNFPPIADMIRDGGATVVLASGELAEVVATRIVYSQATAHLFEQAQSNIAVSGNTALKPQMLAGWQTYNFEVEDLHTYVAECMSASQNDNFTIGKAAA